MKAAKFLTLMLAVPLLGQQGASGQGSPAGCPVPKGTAFTYQGFLTFTNPGGQTSPVDDTCDFEFKLWDCDPGGGQVGPTLTFDGTGTNPPPIEVIEGQFTVQLDFGNEYGGDARFLEITVDCPPPFGGPVTLEPRQELTPVPYALFDHDWDITNTPDMFAVPTGNVGIGTDTPAEKLDVAGNIHATGIIASGGAIWLDGTVTTPFDSVVTDTDFMELLVNTSQRALRLEANATSPNVIGGFKDNEVTPGVVGGTIGGGGRFVLGAPFENIVTADFGTVGGGERNTAAGPGATVGGGHWNTAKGSWSAVGGGFRNSAGGGGWSTVGGGNLNTASGGAATVPGGESNVAAGLTSFAAGRLARALHHGTFVWGDNTAAVFASTAPNQFLIRATGGVGIGTNAPTEKLDVDGQVRIRVLPPGVKDTDIVTVDSTGLLHKRAGGAGATVPIGAVIDWWRPSGPADHEHLPPIPPHFHPPNGYKVCDGSKINDPRSPYDGLFLPDLRDMFVRGIATNAAMGVPGGADSHAHNYCTFDHTHPISDHNHSITMGGSSNNMLRSNIVLSPTTNMARAAHNHPTTIGSCIAPCTSGSSPGFCSPTGTESNVPAYVGLLKIMRIF